MTANRPWWRDAVIYQVYPRSFADANGDGIGDLPGVISRLPYLAELGVDAIWLNPFYPSPQADAGYDVADHRDVEPLFGTLADADALIAGAHAGGIRVIVDVVPNHTSSAHAWFRAALAGDQAARARYIFRAGDGDAPPNGWQSAGICGRTSCTPRSTSRSWSRRGRPARSVPRSTTRCPASPRSARPPPGCSPTTT